MTRCQALSQYLVSHILLRSPPGTRRPWTRARTSSVARATPMAILFALAIPGALIVALVVGLSAGRRGPDRLRVARRPVGCLGGCGPACRQGQREPNGTACAPLQRSHQPGKTAVTQAYVWDTVSSVPELLMDGANAYIYASSSTSAEQVSLVSRTTTYLVADLLFLKGRWRASLRPAGGFWLPSSLAEALRAPTSRDGGI